MPYVVDYIAGLIYDLGVTYGSGALATVAATVLVYSAEEYAVRKALEESLRRPHLFAFAPTRVPSEEDAARVTARLKELERQGVGRAFPRFDARSVGLRFEYAIGNCLDAEGSADARLVIYDTGLTPQHLDRTVWHTPHGTRIVKL